MAEPENPDDLVILARVGDLTTAQLLCGRLDADGIEGIIPDEHMARQLQPAIRGVRVQVRRADLVRAQEVLAQPGVGDRDLAAAMEQEGAAPVSGGKGDEDLNISVGDRAAFRALRVALISLLLMGLVHPYSLWLAARALGRDDITPWGQRRAGIALLVSLAGCAWMGLLLYRLARLAG